jgi:hypothetical protein
MKRREFVRPGWRGGMAVGGARPNRLHLSRERDQGPAPLVAIGPSQNMRLPKKEDGVGPQSQ